ncbi:MAG: hypothetical protein JNN11_00570 [Candidatus Doudnabacteria bacterium]|nr:hypothetical protein [Candidatus Doudnabacteria bacterium]
MLNQKFVEEMKKALLENKTRLENDLKNIPSHTEMGDDEDENAEEINVDEVNTDVTFVMKKDLEKIDKALEKIENGTYGLDNEGREISENRLRALPWADKAI